MARDDRDLSSTRLGGVIEEAVELLRRPFSADEYRSQMLKLQARQTEILESQYGRGGAINLVGGEEEVSITDAAALPDLPVPNNTFEQDETRENVTIPPGEDKNVLEVEADPAFLWYETGTKDETFSEYRYYVDGNRLLTEYQKEPLGLYNDPYRFPQPIIVRGSVEIEVTRTSDASGSADYFSKVRKVPVSASTANALEKAWGSI